MTGPYFPVSSVKASCCRSNARNFIILSFQRCEGIKSRDSVTVLHLEIYVILTLLMTLLSGLRKMTLHYIIIDSIKIQATEK